jgi:pantoate--beta-alanine ligase
MDIFIEIRPIRAFLSTKRERKISIGLIPTMGALHDGHLDLIRASKRENDLTVCSIYINPTQFNNPADLKKYPRSYESDRDKLQKAGCDVIFAPVNQEMYSMESQIHFDFGHLDKILEGEFRPGHFSGVALVVSKLFNIVQPNRAYFGQKDFQQFKIIAKLTEELLFNIKLVTVPIVRESSGLAMSSRNERLSESDRNNATVFYQSLLIARESLLQGVPLNVVKQKVKEKCEAIPGIKLEYVELAATENLKSTTHVSNKTILLIAGYVGEVRLIDNVLLA